MAPDRIALRVAARFQVAKTVELGTVAVDSGTLLMTDPAYVKHWETGKHPELSYETSVAGIPGWEDEPGKQLHFQGEDGPREGAGVLFKTKNGDGLYPVTAEVDDEGRVQSVTVTFDREMEDGETDPAEMFERMAGKGGARYKGKKETDAGNTVYVYSDRQIALRNRRKAKRLEKLKGVIGDLRTQVKKDLRSEDPETFLTALAVGLIDHTYERVGNEGSADDGHYGVTGWQRGHVSMGKGKATIKYVGKAGVKQQKEVRDAALLTALREAIAANDGKESGIFEYDGGRVDARKVNGYLQDHGVTAKDLRGFHANREMQERLTALRGKAGKLPDDKAAREKQLKAEWKKALEGTAEAVGHEPATLNSQYLVPGLEEEFLKDGSVSKSFDKNASGLPLELRVADRFLDEIDAV